MSEAVAVPGPPDLVKYQAYSIEAERIAEAIEITSDEENGMAIDSLSRIKTFQKQVTAAKDEALDPFKVLVNRVRNMFAPIEDSLANAEKVIKDKQKAFVMAREKARAEENARRMAEHAAKVKAEHEAAKAKGEVAPIIAPPPVVMSAPVTTRGEVGQSTVKKFWNYEVFSIDDLYRARPELVEMKERRADILKAISGGVSIPGVRVFEDMRITSR